MPEQAPDQPEKTDPGPGVAARATVAPLLNSASQALPQLIPAGLLVTVPAPGPVVDTPSDPSSDPKKDPEKK